ncbi:MAG: tRNA pseudouridine(38-40) synthase TruA [Bacillaceae bacterium]|nr:tRNA pseudouridine(38-40) synthase TruA [Bacillaceae bacterium]
MRKIKLIVSYDGTDYHGFQTQPGGATIQDELEKAIAHLTGKSVRITGSGRTDAGVHARGQVVHFDTDSSIPPEKWAAALNSKLPEDIIVRHSEAVLPDFHARYDVTAKTYKYLIDQGPVKNVFLRNRAWHIPQTLNLNRMKEAAQYLEGEHDFTSFCSAKTDVEDRVRTLYQVEIKEEGTDGNEIWLTFRGSGFLYNMVRIMTGTLVEVGMGQRGPLEIRQLLLEKDRTRAGKTAPPHGLYLWSVEYKKTTGPRV